MTEPRTINLPGSRARTQTYELAPGLLQYVQAVYVEIDNTAGAATSPLLAVSEQSGVVIAKKAQTGAIGAGTSGSATWALRLDDETPQVNTSGFLHWGTNTDSGSQGLTLDGHGPFSFTAGGHDVAIGTGGAATLTLDANIGNFVLKNNWASITSVGSTSLDVVLGGVLNLTTGAISATAQHAIGIDAHAVAGGADAVTVTGDDGVILQGGGQGVLISSASRGILSGDGPIVLSIPTGQTLTVKDGSGNPIMVLTG